MGKVGWGYWVVEIPWWKTQEKNGAAPGAGVEG